MAFLYFKSRFIPAIRAGEKTTTLRRWKSCRASAGDRVFSPRVGWLHVVRSELINLTDLSDADAHADGFSSLPQLISTLDSLYPAQATDGRQWYRVVFRLEQSTEPIDSWSADESSLFTLPTLFNPPKSMVQFITDFAVAGSALITGPKKLTLPTPERASSRDNIGFPVRQARRRLARHIRGELDKAVEQSGSLFPL